MQTETITRVDIERLPFYRRKTRAGEYSSACPFCLAGRDRFLFWPDKGNYLCRQCGAKGFVVDSPDGLSFTPEQYEAWKRAEDERKAAERQAQLIRVAQINQADNATRYYRQMKDRSYWHSQGLTNATIDQFKLGWCAACPTYQASPSWTIPVYYHGRLISIRHRLANPPAPNDKYRPETAGLPAVIFNADALDDPRDILIVEGEIKAMVMAQMGFQAIGLPGATTFKEKWLKLFKRCQVIYIALDPGADDQAERIGLMLAGIGVDVKVCQMPEKPDDLVVKYKATARDLFRYMVLGKRIQ